MQVSYSRSQHKTQTKYHKADVLYMAIEGPFSETPSFPALDVVRSYLGRTVPSCEWCRGISLVIKGVSHELE